MAKAVADLVTDVLRTTRVKRIYGVVGDSLNGITESLRRSGDFDWVRVRHKEVTAFADGANAIVMKGAAEAARRAWRPQPRLPPPSDRQLPTARRFR